MHYPLTERYLCMSGLNSISLCKIDTIFSFMVGRSEPCTVTGSKKKILWLAFCFCFFLTSSFDHSTNCTQHFLAIHR